MNLLTRFQQLTGCLERNRAYWQLRPFHVLPDRKPECLPTGLWHWLMRLPEREVMALADLPRELVQAMGPWVADADLLPGLTGLPPLPCDPQSVPAHLARDVPGRKWQQVQAFARHLVPPVGPVIEWCAGKGHLGRLVAGIHGVPVTSLEWDPALCEQGSRLAGRFGVRQRLVCQDVMDDGVAGHLQGAGQALALHACGSLHGQLLRFAGASGPQSLALSPCCYHRIPEPVYRPFSSAGRACDLQLERQDLQLAVRETVTGGRRIRRLRDLEVAWRLGFDSLQRELRRVDSYLPLPSIAKGLLSGRFEEFCHWACATKGLNLPQVVDFSRHEAMGWERLSLVRRLELIGHLFRRPLEVWLVLDRALFLESRGYRVQVGEFCSRTLTPRNLLIRAERAGA